MPVATKLDKVSNNNFMIIMLLITLLVVGVSGLAVNSLFGAAKRDLKVAQAKDKADKQLKADVSAAPNLVAAYSALGSQTQLLADALPTTIDLPSLLVMMENMSNDAGLKLKSVAVLQATGVGTTDGGSTAGSVGAPVPQPYAFSVSYDGTYSSLQKFLKDVELSARPMRVIGMQMNGSGSALSGEVDIQTYYQDRAQLPLTKEAIK